MPRSNDGTWNLLSFRAHIACFPLQNDTFSFLLYPQLQTQAWVGILESEISGLMMMQALFNDIMRTMSERASDQRLMIADLLPYFSTPQMDIQSQVQIWLYCRSSAADCIQMVYSPLCWLTFATLLDRLMQGLEYKMNIIDLPNSGADVMPVN